MPSLSFPEKSGGVQTKAKLQKRTEDLHYYLQRVVKTQSLTGAWSSSCDVGLIAVGAPAYAPAYVYNRWGDLANGTVPGFQREPRSGSRLHEILGLANIRAVHVWGGGVPRSWQGCHRLSDDGG
jgi:hypothetical protein